MSEATGSKPYSEDEAYLYETYVTEDGIEVPPPTKVRAVLPATVKKLPSTCARTAAVSPRSLLRTWAP